MRLSYLKFNSYLLAFLSLIGFNKVFSNDLFNTDSILPLNEAFQISHYLEENHLIISWKIAPNYYLYKKAFNIVQNHQEINYLLTGKIDNIDDIYFGKVRIYRDKVFLKVLLKDLKSLDVDMISVEYQGCAEKKYCYPMASTIINVAKIH